MAHMPAGFVNQAHLEEAVAEAVKSLNSHEVHDVRFSLGEDASGEPSIFFGILLTPQASRATRLADVTGRVTTALFDRLQPYNRWGLQPYFNFTSDRAHFRNSGWMQMAFAEDLLKQAFLLLNKESKNPSQASLRRSVSTAYYALFHLLIQEASSNWSRTDTRDYLARAFEHKTMKEASTRAENADYDVSVPAQVVSKLRSVARAFRELQFQRHLTDYSNATKWDRTKAAAKVNQAKSAFGDWKSIRNEHVAQKYLVSLLSNYKEG